jgi:hypothetical protein
MSVAKILVPVKIFEVKHGKIRDKSRGSRLSYRFILITDH